MVTALVAAGYLAGCGSSSHTASSTAAPQSTTSSTAALLGPTLCQASGLQVALADSGDGAAATRYLTFHATNTSKAECSLGGYFKVAAYGLDGKPIETRNSHAPGTPVQQLHVAPGGTVAFVAGINDLASGPEGQCTRVGSFRLQPPGTTTAVTFHPTTGGIVECAGVISVRAAASV